MSSHREWTNAELIAELSKLPMDAPIRLEDADISWEISKFALSYNNTEGKNQIWFYPCDYGDMK